MPSVGRSSLGISHPHFRRAARAEQKLVRELLQSSRELLNRMRTAELGTHCASTMHGFIQLFLGVRKCCSSRSGGREPSGLRQLRRCDEFHHRVVALI
jgi:hypothetical protein